MSHASPKQAKHRGRTWNSRLPRFSERSVSCGVLATRREGRAGDHVLLALLTTHAGEWLSGEELRAASGFIDNWARRIRELRVQEGYSISEEGDMYRLEATTPSAARAVRWRTLNAIRRTKGSGFVVCSVCSR